MNNQQIKSPRDDDADFDEEKAVSVPDYAKQFLSQGEALFGHASTYGVGFGGIHQSHWDNESSDEEEFKDSQEEQENGADSNKSDNDLHNDE